MMLTTHQHPDLGLIELAKGAPEEVIPRCADLTEPEARAAMLENERMASRGLRVLAFAWRRDPNAPLEFAGLVGLHDPPRPRVRQALAELERAGIRTLMLTGDQGRTAIAVGAALGIPEDAVHSSVTPEAKLDIVEA